MNYEEENFNVDDLYIYIYIVETRERRRELSRERAPQILFGIWNKVEGFFLFIYYILLSLLLIFVVEVGLQSTFFE